MSCAYATTPSCARSSVVEQRKTRARRQAKQVAKRRSCTRVVLDMDSSVGPTHGEQEGSLWNGHSACTYDDDEGAPFSVHLNGRRKWTALARRRATAAKPARLGRGRPLRAVGVAHVEDETVGVE